MSTEMDDYIEGGSGNEALFGLQGNDTLVGFGGHDQLDGGEGSDSLNGGDGNDTLLGGQGYWEETHFDTASYADAAGGVTVDLGRETAQDTGGAGVDTLIGIERLVGSVYNDVLTGGPLSAPTTLWGGAGDDTLAASGGAAHAGDGTDTLTFARITAGSPTNVSVDLTGQTYRLSSAGFPPVWIDGQVTGVEVVIGSGNGDIIKGSSWGEQLWGGRGNDLLIGESGDDGLGGDEGDDQLYGGDGHDALGGSLGADWLLGEQGDDLLLGGADNDTLDGGADADRLDGGGGVNTLLGGDGDDALTSEGRDILDGGAGRDSVTLRLFLSGFEADLGAGTAGRLGDPPTATLIDVEDLIGDAYSDRLTGSMGANVLEGHGGEDTLVGADGDDSLDGGTGNDTLDGGVGHDRLTGGVGNVLTPQGGADSLNGGTGDDTLAGGDGDDTLVGAEGRDTVSYAGAAAVIVNLSRADAQPTGGAGVDTIIDVESVEGSSAADKLTGDRGGNRLAGAHGDDTLSGGKGRDVLVGGIGADDLIGGRGADRFVVSALADSSPDPLGRDDVRGFSSAEGDRIDLSRVDAVIGRGDDAFVVVDAFSGVAGQLVITPGRRFTLVQGDVDGDGQPDLAIAVYLADSGADPLDANDFML
jgi:Ca2+-binding RTX toxin-like protein